MCGYLVTGDGSRQVAGSIGRGVVEREIGRRSRAADIDVAAASITIPATEFEPVPEMTRKNTVTPAESSFITNASEF